MRKKSIEEGAHFPITSSSPSLTDRTLSASSDSGLSVASQTLTGARQLTGAASDNLNQARKLLPGVDFEIAQSLLEVMAELAACSGGNRDIAGGESGLGGTLNGEASSSERETDILDDEDEVDNVAASALDIPSSSSIGSLSSEKLPETQRPVQVEYSTQSWVRQQLMVDPVTDNYTTVDVKDRKGKERPPPLVAPNTPPRGISSREAVQRGLVDDNVTRNTTSSPSSQEEELASLTTDVDESIEQLNQLILDLDPTFVPVPTHCPPLSRSASLHTNGLSHKGGRNLSGKRKQKLRTGPLSCLLSSHSCTCSF